VAPPADNHPHSAVCHKHCPAAPGELDEAVDCLPSSHDPNIGRSDGSGAIRQPAVATSIHTQLGPREIIG